MKYEYDASMDESYQRSLVKSFKKTVDDDLFDLIIVDMINEKMAKIDEMNLHAKMKGFHVYVIELTQADAATCFSRNVHNRQLDEIKRVILNILILKQYLKIDMNLKLTYYFFFCT